MFQNLDSNMYYYFDKVNLPYRNFIYGGIRMDLLKDLYYGRINSFEEMYTQSPEYEKAVKKMIEKEEKLREQCPDCQALFEEYRIAINTATDIAEYEKFALGFRTGMLLMLELLKES